PIDITRPNCLGLKNIKEILPYVDMIEIVNSRTIAPSLSRRIPKFSQQYSLLAVAGSDAHTLDGIGRVLMEIEDFKDKQDFLRKLKNGKIITKSNLFYPYISTGRKIYRRFKRKVVKNRGS
ncbi:MAG: hypothetical protein GTO02_04295, partial [Candidatus Dadabacteria bacterium]|nr:hypothetical protein [Candidatus Dadabacteria bacterium]NIQ13641.1 hypothetical protein [Candidatus Dadabacteria bacterium]